MTTGGRVEDEDVDGVNFFYKLAAGMEKKGLMGGNDDGEGMSGLRSGFECAASETEV